MFARGLLPRDWLPVSERAECNEVKIWESVDFSECAKNHVLFASDGSGGSRTTPQTLRQVAFGVATFDMHIGNDTSFTLQQTGYLGGQVPGKQTVSRAELWGAIQILSKVNGKSNIQIPIDEGHCKQGDLVQGPNGDLWSILFQLIDERSGVTDFIKVKVALGRRRTVSHQTKQDRLPPHARKLPGRCGGRRSGKTSAARFEPGT